MPRTPRAAAARLREFILERPGDGAPPWLVTLDLVLGATVFLMLFTRLTVVFFHLTFVWLAVGAFYWSLRSFTIHGLIWVSITSTVVLVEIAQGITAVDEWAEIPMLSLILVVVFLIARRRARTLSALTVSVERQRVLSERVREMALQDSLTGLPNRAAFIEQLDRAIARATRRGLEVAVLFLDLDGFKDVNDSLGHEAGDKLLIAIAKRLRGCLRPEDTVARLGGDEFTILIEEAPDVRAAVRVAERIAVALAEPVDLEGRSVAVTSSIGIALTGPNGHRGSDLMRDADEAMYRAKGEGKARHAVFETGMHAGALARLELEGDLRGAAERGELVLHFQPVVTLATLDVVGVEALVRWRHPRRGLLYPGDFLAVAETSGLIVPLGRWVLDEACRQLRIWQERYPSDPPLNVGVNLSAREFRQSDLSDHASRVLHELRLPPGSLTIELTEGLLITQEDIATVALARLKSIGVRVAIDDFGTGHSSLAYLKRFPVDLIKIDKSFVLGLGHDPKDAGIVGVLVQFARIMDMALVAEGVETEQQAEQLLSLGCTVGQGYFFARPQDAEALSALLAANEYVAGRGVRLRRPADNAAT